MGTIRPGEEKSTHEHIESLRVKYQKMQRDYDMQI
jgi:hypothetical protein